MFLQEFLAASDGHVSGGSEFMWKCYGPDARFMDISDIDSAAAHIFNRTLYRSGKKEQAKRSRFLRPGPILFSARPM